MSGGGLTFRRRVAHYAAGGVAGCAAPAAYTCRSMLIHQYSAWGLAVISKLLKATTD